MLLITVAGNWQAAAYTVIYPLWRTAKSEAHIAACMSPYSTNDTLTPERADALFLISLAID